MRAVTAALLVFAALTAAPAHAETIDIDRSESLFSVHLRWLQRLDARFTRFDGKLERLPDGDRRVQVRLETDSVEFPKHPRYTEWAKADDFFDTARYREIRFRSDPFDQTVLREGGHIDGDLWLRGIERGTRFYIAPARCERPGFDCAIEVQGTARRSQYGMTAWRFAMRDRVRFAFRIWLKQEPPA